MILTIVPEDGLVIVDNVMKHQPLDLSGCGIPENVHALQWYGAKGWIEFNRADPFAPKPQNQEITVLPEWATNCVTVWESWIVPTPTTPTNREITANTINTANGCLVAVSGLATQALQEHISLESNQAVTQYIHDIGNILADAQAAYVNNEAYSPTFPIQPTMIPAVDSSQFSSKSDAYIQFVTEK